MDKMETSFLKILRQEFKITKLGLSFDEPSYFIRSQVSKLEIWHQAINIPGSNSS